jgi:drug/metabolite transporter (DMT)-like permease
MNSSPLRIRLSEISFILVAATWGSTFFIIKDSVRVIDPMLLVAYRFLLAALALGIVLLIMRRNLLQDLWPGVILGVLLFLCFAPQAIGLQYISAANSGFITGTFVVFLPIFSLLFFKVTIQVNKWIAVLVSLGGLALLTGGFAGLNQGDLLTLITAMAIALHILVADRFVRRAIDPIILAFQQFLVTGIAWGFAPSLALPNTATMLAIGYLALFPSLGAYVVQLTAQRVVGPVKVALYFALEPVFAALFAWTIGGEHIVVAHALGGVLIFIAILVSEIPLPVRAGRSS